MLTTFNLTAQVAVSDLTTELESGTIKLGSAVGNGNSSGSSVEGSLINDATSIKHIDIYLARPLFLANRGTGQNMVAAQVYLGDGGYFSDGSRSYIILKSKIRTRIRFVAYCVDFEKDNPTRADTFSIGTTPPELVSVMDNIKAYSAANPDADITKAAQVSIWLAQGETPTEIRSKFPFTAEDETLARTFTKK